jgi:putative ABC transport system permease protein
MRWLNILRARLHALVRREALISDIAKEMNSHVEMEKEANIARGMPPEEAQAVAIRNFGNMGRFRELAYDIRGGGLLEAFWQDLRFGARMLLKQPGFTVIALSTLCLGIGANTAIFSIVNAVLLRPFPYQAPERLVLLRERVSEGTAFSPSYLNFADWRAQNTLCSSMAAVRGDESFNFTGSGEPERLQGRLVSAEFFATLGIRPVVGREFVAEEDGPGAAPVVILSYRFWQRRFHADPRTIGQQVTLNNQSFTVVGITPPEFEFGAEADVTVPIGLQAERFRPRGKDPGVDVVARLKPNVGEQQAETELNLIAARLEQQYPESNKGLRVVLTPLHESFVGGIRQPLLTLLGAVGLVLLIACANVASLLLVRASARQKEMSVRVALGASRATLVRQLLTESMLLAAFGAMLGILLAFLGTRLIATQLPDGIPRLQEADVDLPVLLFALAISLFTGLLFGLVPALQASRPNVTEGLKERERGSSGPRQRLRSMLVVGEVALTLALLVGAGLLIQSFRRVLQVDPGFKPQHVLTMQLSVDNPDGQQVANFFEQLQQKVHNLPGVKSVAVSDGLPFEMANYPAFIIEGRPIQKKPSGLRYNVSPDYFETMGIALIKGRFFTAHDTRDTQPVVIINDVLAQRYFPNDDPLGKRLKQSLDSPSLEIVGIVRHVEHYNLDGQRAAQNQFYINFNQISLQNLPNSVGYMNLLVRTEVEPLSLGSAVRAQVAALNKDQAVFNVRTMEQVLAHSVAARRFSMFLLTVFAMVALALASLGIYGLMSYLVAQRTREIGMRKVLGAQVSDVLKLVISQGMRLVLTGLALGLIASVALTRTMRNLLFGVSATDPATFAAPVLLLIAVALLACFVPARRATKVDPMVALRGE